jgi:hypothetical protein
MQMQQRSQGEQNLGNNESENLTIGVPCGELSELYRDREVELWIDDEGTLDNYRALPQQLANEAINCACAQIRDLCGLELGSTDCVRKNNCGGGNGKAN